MKEAVCLPFIFRGLLARKREQSRTNGRDKGSGAFLDLTTRTVQLDNLSPLYFLAEAAHERPLARRHDGPKPCLRQTKC